MTDQDFRRLALQIPAAIEASHMGHPDFRLNGKVFATLHYPDRSWGMVKLSPEHQHSFMQTHPHMFKPVNGAWGRQGCTNVCLEAADVRIVEDAIKLAASNLSTSKAVRKPRRAK